MENFHTVQDGKKYFFQVTPDEFGMVVNSVVFNNELHMFPSSVAEAGNVDLFDSKHFKAIEKKAKAKYGVGRVHKHPQLVARIKKVGHDVELTAINVASGNTDSSAELLAILKT